MRARTRVPQGGVWGLRDSGALLGTPQPNTGESQDKGLPPQSSLQHTWGDSGSGPLSTCTA